MKTVFSSHQNGWNWVLRLVLGGAFILAGLLKISDPAKFAEDVSNYRLLPYEWTNLVAIFLPWIELVTGLFLLTGVWMKAAALVATAMTLTFFVVIVSALARGLNIECGCFGTIGGKHIGLVNLAIDSVLLILSLILALPSKTHPANDTFSEADTQNTVLRNRSSRSTE